MRCSSGPCIGGKHSRVARRSKFLCLNPPRTYYHLPRRAANCALEPIALSTGSSSAPTLLPLRACPGRHRSRRVVLGRRRSILPVPRWRVARHARQQPLERRTTLDRTRSGPASLGALLSLRRQPERCTENVCIGALALPDTRDLRPCPERGRTGDCRGSERGQADASRRRGAQGRRGAGARRGRCTQSSASGPRSGCSALAALPRTETLRGPAGSGFRRSGQGRGGIRFM